MSTIYWQSDPLYKLILHKAEELWRWCKPDDQYSQYVLIEETSDEYEGIPAGNTIRSWIRDTNGVREISKRELAQHIEKIEDSYSPFIRMTFYVFPDREHVSIGESTRGRSGMGVQYVVRRYNDIAKLEPDPDGTSSGWIV